MKHKTTTVRSTFKPTLKLSRVVLHVREKFVIHDVFVNELDGTDGSQDSHDSVHDHNGNIDEHYKRVLRVAHFEERNDGDDEVQRRESHSSAEGNEVAEEGNGSCNDSDDHNVDCGHCQSYETVVDAQGGLVVVHHLLLNVEVGRAAINLGTWAKTTTVNVPCNT